MTDADEAVTFTLSWGDVDIEPKLVNQLLIQLAFPLAGTADGGIHLVLGHLNPPLLIGTAEEQMRLARENPALQVHVYGRYFLTRRRAEELVKTLSEMIDRYDAQAGKQDAEH